MHQFRLKPWFLVIAGLLSFAMGEYAFGQKEYVPSNHPVYRFLLRQQLAGRIIGFDWGMLPVSREEVARNLMTLRSDSASFRLPSIDRAELQEYLIEFAYDMDGTLDRARAFLPNFDFRPLADNENRRYVHAYVDSTAAVFVNVDGSLTGIFSRGDSLKSGGTRLGELGVSIRGTLFHHLGFSLRATNGALLGGSHDLAVLDHRLAANRKFNSDEKNFYDQTSGYLRYDTDWLAVTFGRDQILWGNGYADRAVFSDNTVPFDFFRIDLHSNSFRYSFLHGSLVGGDSTGHTLSSKYVAAHRFEFNAGRRVRIAFSEAVLYTNQSVNFALMNPFTFLTSAELSTELPTAGDDAHNTLMWLDFEARPVDGIRFYGSVTVDDLKLSTIGKNDISGNSNKFAWQGGANWNEPLGLEGILLVLEYTRINPFVFSHWTNAAAFTNWNFSLGPSLPSNSDEWLLGADCSLTSRLTLRLQGRFQRGGESIHDSTGAILFDAGEDIIRGQNHLVHPNVFLEGNRVNRILVSGSIEWQPVRQYYVRIDGLARFIHYPANDQRVNDQMLTLTLRAEY